MPPNCPDRFDESPRLRCFGETSKELLTLASRSRGGPSRADPSATWLGPSGLSSVCRAGYASKTSSGYNSAPYMSHLCGGRTAAIWMLSSLSEPVGLFGLHHILQSSLQQESGLDVSIGIQNMPSLQGECMRICSFAEPRPFRPILGRNPACRLEIAAQNAVGCPAIYVACVG